MFARAKRRTKGRGIDLCGGLHLISAQIGMRSEISS